MLKKFIVWFIVFGLSFLVSDVFGWTEQGIAFLYINIGAQIIVVVIEIILLIGIGMSFQEVNPATTGLSLGVSVALMIYSIVLFAITLFATWGATKLFNVDFYIAYQIMTFGQCLCTTEAKKKDD